MGPEEQCGGEFPGFSFFPICIRLKGEKVGNVEIQTDADQITQQKPTLSKKIIKEGQSSQTKFLDNNQLPQPISQQKLLPKVQERCQNE